MELNSERLILASLSIIKPILLKNASASMKPLNLLFSMLCCKKKSFLSLLQGYVM
jgi:hypothetical protein